MLATFIRGEEVPIQSACDIIQIFLCEGVSIRVFLLIKP